MIRPAPAACPPRTGLPFLQHGLLHPVDLMHRRHFLKTGLLAAAATMAGRPAAAAPPARSSLRITRIRCYRAPDPNPTFNQSNVLVTVETNEGLTGVGEGGTPDLVTQLAGQLIGEDPFRTEHLWQRMYRGYFYPPGREKLHALGALDLALWDLKGKALGVPVYEMLGGLTRDHVDCYATAFPDQGSIEATARACIETGFAAYRFSVLGPGTGQPFDPDRMIAQSVDAARQARAGVGDAHWAVDYHTRFDPPQAVRYSALIEDLQPLFAEDLVRSENPGLYRMLREKVNVPIAVGEQFGDRWDLNELVEQHLIDYARVTLPNAGGITEFMKLAALCETHYVGLVPHFTGPVATAALVHACGACPNPVYMEILGAAPAEQPHLPEHVDFRQGKLYPNDRPGLGVTFDPARATLQAEITEPYNPIPLFHRPDGSIQNW